MTQDMSTTYRSKKQVTREMAGFGHTLAILMSMLRVCLEYAWRQPRVCLEYAYNEITARPSRDYGSSSTTLRLVISLLLLLVTGVADLLAAPINFKLPDGYYYLGNDAGANDVPVYDDTDFSANFYMCPVYSTNVVAKNYLDGEETKPLITSFKSFSDSNKNQGKTYSWAVWYIEAATGDNAGYFYIKHRDTEQYLIANDNSSPAANRRRINLGPKSKEDDCLFRIQSDDNGGTYYISSKTKSASNNNKYLNPSNGNKDYLEATSDNSDTGGIFGFYSSKTQNSAWHFIPVPCETPVFTYDNTSNTVTIASGTLDANIYYTIDDTPLTDSSTPYSGPFSVDDQTTIKAIATKSGYANSEIASVRIVLNPTITLAQTVYTYSGSAIEPVVTSVMDGETPIDDNEYTVSYADNTNAGTATVNIIDNEGGNYIVYGSKNFTINKKDLTVTAKPKIITYGEVPSNDGVTYSGFVGEETSTELEGSLDYDYSYVQYGDVGDTYTITPKGLTSNNYNISFVPGTLTVIQKEVGLTWNPTDSSTPIATYDGQSHAPTVTANAADLVNGDVISVTVTPSANEGSSLTGTDAINAGSYTATASGLTGTKAGNYSLPDENSQTFTISPKPVTVSGITVSDKIYDGTTDATIDISGAAIDGIVSGDNLSVASVTGTFDTKDVGTDKTVTVVITTEGTSADNYELSASGLTADITPKPLTIKANDNAIGYGTAAVDNGVTYDSFVVGEDESLLEGTLTYVFNTSADGTGDAYTTSSPKGTYYIIPGGLHLPDGNNNYAISFAYGTLTVGPRKIGNGTDFAEGFTVNIDTSTSPYALTVYDGSTALIQGTTGTDYDYSIDTSESTDKYYVATITGANNYSDAVADRAIVKYANVRFDSDGSPGAMWYGTFVAEADHATPAGMTPYIITSVADNTATAVELDYIPNGVPVVLMNAEDAKGFLVQSGTGEISTTGNLLAVQATDEEKATATVYLLYKGEFVLNKAGILKAGTVYLPVSAGGGSGARLKISRGGSAGIENIEYTIDSQSGAWYTLDGRRLSSKPTKKGIYLQGGKKTVVK